MHRYILACFGILLCVYAGAQQNGHNQYDRIQKAYAGNIEFTELKLFIQTGTETNSKLSNYATLKPVQENISRLYMHRNDAVALTVQAANGKNYTLEMVQSHPLSDQADIGYIDHKGRHRIEYEQALHYQGAIRGEKMSIATMSVFADGEVMILFSDKDGNFNLGKMQDESGKYVLYNTKERTEAMPFTCLVNEDNIEIQKARAQNKTTGAVECKKVRIYWEVDSAFLAYKGGLTTTQNYISGLFNIMQGIYYNDGIVIEMTGMYIWTTDDRYTKQNQAWRLGHFYAYWNGQGKSFPGDLAMLLGRATSGNGFGYYDGICGNAPYSIAPIWSGYNNFPAFDWDVYITSHETGHNFYALHTHSCGWRTGPGGTCGSVDNCSIQEAATGCPTCPFLFDINSPSGWQGTVMSYCGGHINFSAGFGPTVAAHMRNKVDTASCLKNVIEAELVTKGICNNDGSIMLNFKTNNFGVAPYIYVWSNNVTTKDLNNLVSPGIYMVFVTDSNNCSLSKSIELKKYGQPGNGQAPAMSMPLCCKDTSFMVTLDASLPVSLSQCQTVGWLRTTTPLTSYQQAKTAYANAGAGDILGSSNDSIISATTAAALIIKSPDTCTQTKGYYYTPFVTRKAKAAASYSVNAGSPVQVKMFQKQIGNSVVIPNQGQPAVCDEYNNNITDTITVTISSYTGRANHLSIRITDEDDEQELYVKHNHSGNGVYVIPISGIKNHMQQMTVRAYDHNCKNSDTCNLVTMNIQATRKVTYAAVPALSFDSSCLVGTSVFLSFGPDSCDVGIREVGHTIRNMSLHPNPAKGSATLHFYVGISGNGSLRLTDIAGRIVREAPLTYRVGNNEQILNLAGIAGGVYFVSMYAEGNTVHIKLLVQ